MLEYISAAKSAIDIISAASKAKKELDKEPIFFDKFIIPFHASVNSIISDYLGMMRGLSNELIALRDTRESTEDICELEKRVVSTRIAIDEFSKRRVVMLPLRREIEMLSQGYGRVEDYGSFNVYFSLIKSIFHNYIPGISERGSASHHVSYFLNEYHAESKIMEAVSRSAKWADELLEYMGAYADHLERVSGMIAQEYASLRIKFGK